MAQPTSSADASTVRHLNERAVIAALTPAEGLKVSQIAAATGLTSASTGDVLRGLLRKGWAVEGEPERSGMGRPARTYRLAQLPISVLGVDVGGHTVRSVLLRPDGTHDEVARVTVAGASVEATLAAVREAVADVDEDDIWQCGVAVSGAIDGDGNVVSSVALPHLAGLNAAQVLAEAVPGKLRIYHDTRAALWAELSETGEASDCHVMLVHLGRRPSVAWFLNGAEYVGAHGTAGDLAASDVIQPWAGPIEAAAAGDLAAVASARQYFRQITPQLAFAIALVDPASVVIAGALAPAVREVAPEFVAAVEERVQAPPQVRVSDLDEFAVAIGAARLAREHVVNRLLDHPGGVAPVDRSSIVP